MADCPYCHSCVEDSYKFCRSCGANLSLPEFDRAFCPYCGNRVGTRQWYCPVCEKPLEKEYEETGPVPPPPAAPRKIQTKRSPRNIAKLAGVGLIILFLIGTLIWKTSPKQSPVKPSAISVGKIAAVSNRASPAPAATVPLSPTAVNHSLTRPKPQAVLRQQLTKVLNNLQEAQLKKDIAQYLQSYLSSFPDLETKRQKTLSAWKVYDYTALHYDLKDIAFLDNNTSVAQVSWNIKVHNKVNQKNETFTRVYKVWFAREGNSWRVKNLEEIPPP
jgi:hypothetical protein